MERLQMYAGLALIALTPAFAATSTTTPARQLMKQFGQKQTVFEQNVGQAPPGSGFIGRGLSHAVELDATGATLRTSEQHRDGFLKMVLLGANQSAVGVGVDPAATKIDYRFGNDPAKWMVNVPVFKKIKYQEVWPGVDVVYYGNEGLLEYDLVLNPGANLDAVRFQFSGAKSLKLSESGDLLLETTEGSLEQRRPRIYQKSGDKLVDVAGHYQIDGGVVRFVVPDYDPAQALVIDPQLLFSRPLDSIFRNVAGVAIDAAGNSYYTGQGLGQVMPNVFQLEAFLVKLDLSGTPLVIITFGGVSQPSAGTGIALDPSGNIYITGSTAASDFSPLLSGFQKTLAGGTDGFLVKFNPAIQLIYSTFMGGAGADQGNAVVADSTGRAYVVGQTASAAFPTSGIGPPFHAGSATMAFAVKVDTTNLNAAEVWGTLLGGSGTDYATGVGVDSSFNVTVAGTTTSTDFLPHTTTGYSPAKTNGANPDGFVVVLNASGTGPNYFTYWPFGAINGLYTSASTAYVTGETNGNIFTVNPYQASGGANHAFVTKFNTATSGTGSVNYSTYLGGSATDIGYGIAADAAGNAYVVGTSGSANFPQTVGAVPLPPGSIPEDGFFTILNPNTGASGLVYSTLLGGNNNDVATSIAVSPLGDSYIAANSLSTNFLGGTTSGVFGLKFSTGATLTPVTGSGSSQTYTFTFTDPNGYQDIAGSQIVINSTLSGANSCYILFARPGTISLADNTGNTFSSTTLGTPSILQNSQCSVIASLTTQSGSGNTVTLNLTVAFKAAFAGPKNVYTNFNNNAGVSSGWDTLGTYTATAPAQLISVTSVMPASGTGPGQAFTFNYSDPSGAPDISGSQILFNTSVTAVNGCYILFSSNNVISLGSDDGNTFMSAALGQQTVLQNSQCLVYPSDSYQTQLGANLSVTVFVAFKPAFQGTKTIYSNANTISGVNSGFSTLGSWTVPASSPTLAVNSVTPAAATGPSQALTFIYGDANGFADIISAQVVINPTNATTNSCVVTFTRATGVIALTNDSGSGSTTATLGQATTLQNSRCIVNAASSYQYGAGNFLSLTLFVTMKTSGSQNLYTSVTSTGTSVPTAQVGTWNVTSPSTLTPVSVVPLTGATPSGTSQYFTFTMSDPVGAGDISGALIVLYPSLQGSSSCYILYGHNNNIISLASDSALTFSTATLGTAGLLQNTQCTLDPSKSFAVQTGDTINLTLSVSFKTPLKSFPLLYSFVNVETAAAVFSGWFVESRFTVQ